MTTTTSIEDGGGDDELSAAVVAEADEEADTQEVSAMLCTRDYIPVWAACAIPFQRVHSASVRIPPLFNTTTLI